PAEDTLRKNSPWHHEEDRRRRSVVDAGDDRRSRDPDRDWNGAEGARCRTAHQCRRCGKPGAGGGKDVAAGAASGAVVAVVRWKELTKFAALSWSRRFRACRRSNAACGNYEDFVSQGIGSALRIFSDLRDEARVRGKIL